MKATNNDSKRTLEYSITGGDDNDVFKIDNKGHVILNSWPTNELLKSTYKLTITVTDNGTPQNSDSATLTVYVHQGV